MRPAPAAKAPISDRLPSPTGVALRIIELADRPDATPNAIADVVQTDPAMAARLIKLVNAPLNGVPRRIASVSTAVGLLGLRTVKSVALGFSLVANNRVGDCPSFDYEGFWSESVGRAAAARHLAHHLRTLGPDEAFTVGLLSQIGRLALACLFPGKYARFCNDAQAEHLTRDEAGTFGVDHNNMAADMMGQWGLPDSHCLAVRHQDDPDTEALESGSPAHQLARTIHVAGLIASVLVEADIDGAALESLNRAAETFGIPVDRFQDTFDAISAEWYLAGAMLSITTREVPRLTEIYWKAHDLRSDLEETSD